MSEADFSSFYSEVKKTEREDSKYTPEQQINRLLRPGSTYANLNPFEVLMVDPEDSLEIIKKQYRKLSILCHPDKNPDNRERAQQAFDALSKAHKQLQDEKSREKALDVVEEAKYKVKTSIEEKKRKLRAEGRSSYVEEDDPAKYKEAVRVMTIKLFADQERKRKQLEDRVQEAKKRKHEEDEATVAERQAKKEWEKNFEESRQNRVNSWQSFSKKSKRKDIRPPKHKAETK